MIIRAAAEEHAHSSNTNGARYFDPISQSHLAPSGRRRDGESPRPPGGPGVASSTNHYSQSAPASYPANQSAPGSLRNVQGSQGHVYTTHVFAPVVTGAPTKKSKFPNTAANTGVPGESYQFFSQFRIWCSSISFLSGYPRNAVIDPVIIGAYLLKECGVRACF